MHIDNKPYTAGSIILAPNEIGTIPAPSGQLLRLSCRNTGGEAALSFEDGILYLNNAGAAQLGTTMTAHITLDAGGGLRTRFHVASADPQNAIAIQWTLIPD